MFLLIHLKLYKLASNSFYFDMFQICDAVNSEQWTVERHPDGNVGTVAHRGDQWVGYDDVSDVRRKVTMSIHYKVNRLFELIKQPF